MNYYVIQVKTGSENKFIKLYKSNQVKNELPVHFPMRQLDIRKNGKLRVSKLPVFPGYLFIEASSDEEMKICQWDFRKIEGFQRFLPSNSNLTPLLNRDLELVLHFINKTGHLAGKSKVYFDENSRIVVLDGPLSGLEGRILKVDKRKGRAKIKLDIYDDSFAIDLAFEVIAPS